MNTIDPISKAMGRQSAILMASAVAALCALFAGHSVFTSSRFYLAVPVALFGGYLAAMGFREFADFFLENDERPWYIRPGAMVFLTIALIVFNATYLTLGRIAAPWCGMAGVFDHRARLFEALAVELFWIAMLDRPSRSSMAPLDAYTQNDDPTYPLHKESSNDRNHLRS